MHNSHSFGSKSGRGGGSVKRPAPPDHQQQQQQQWQYPAGYDYQSYYAAWQNYQSQNPYYNYDQTYGGYGSGYQYQSASQFPTYQPYPAAQPAATTSSQPIAAVAAAPPPEAPPVTPATSTATDTEQQSTTAASNTQYYNVPYDNAETFIEEHDVPLDIEKMNNETIQNNDDLYDALEESRWLTTDVIDGSLIRVK